MDKLTKFKSEIDKPVIKLDFNTPLSNIIEHICQKNIVL